MNQTRPQPTHGQWFRINPCSTFRCKTFTDGVDAMQRLKTDARERHPHWHHECVFFVQGALIKTGGFITPVLGRYPEGQLFKVQAARVYADRYAEVRAYLWKPESMQEAMERLDARGIIRLEEWGRRGFPYAEPHHGGWLWGSVPLTIAELAVMVALAPERLAAAEAVLREHHPEVDVVRYRVARTWEELAINVSPERLIRMAPWELELLQHGVVSLAHYAEVDGSAEAGTPHFIVCAMADVVKVNGAVPSWAAWAKNTTPEDEER